MLVTILRVRSNDKDEKVRRSCGEVLWAYRMEGSEVLDSTEESHAIHMRRKSYSRIKHAEMADNGCESKTRSKTGLIGHGSKILDGSNCRVSERRNRSGKSNQLGYVLPIKTGTSGFQQSYWILIEVVAARASSWTP